MPDIVYALTNPAMPGMVKIGMTENLQNRMTQLYSTGVPLPFECVYAIELVGQSAAAIESALHAAFQPYRVNASREFFEIETYQVERLLRAFPGTDATPRVTQQLHNLDPVGEEAARSYRRRRPNFNFVQMGVLVGSNLLSLDSGEKATVVGEKRVSFRDEEMSLTQASRIAAGLDYAVPPTPRWTFEGRNLGDIYRETYGVQGALAE